MSGGWLCLFTYMSRTLAPDWRTQAIKLKLTGWRGAATKPKAVGQDQYLSHRLNSLSQPNTVRTAWDPSLGVLSNTYLNVDYARPIRDVP